MHRRLISLVFVALTSIAQAQQPPVDTITQQDSGVSLRDYETSRLDALRQVMDERDTQYAQRFEAQQKALADALQAAKEAVANALAASKEAVLKAEDANNKRFESVNEFRNTLTDQATKFMTKDEANARLKAMEDDLVAINKRLDDERSRSEGASGLWILIAGVAVVLVTVGGFAVNIATRRQNGRA